jgi:hypothetical protein
MSQCALQSVEDFFGLHITGAFIGCLAAWQPMNIKILYQASYIYFLTSADHKT